MNLRMKAPKIRTEEWITKTTFYLLIQKMMKLNDLKYYLKKINYKQGRGGDTYINKER